MQDKEFLRYLRKYLKVSQRELAEKLNSNQQTISMVEAGNREIPKSIVEQIYKTLNIDYYTIRHTLNTEVEFLNYLNELESMKNYKYSEDLCIYKYKVTITTCIEANNSIEVLEMISNSWDNRISRNIKSVEIEKINE